MMKMSKMTIFVLALLLTGAPFMQAKGATAEAQEKQIICIGDSITFGYKRGKKETQPYPQQVGLMLNGDWNVGNWGSSGTTMASYEREDGRLVGYLNYPVRFEMLAKTKPSIAVIMLGTNDAGLQPWNEKYKAIFEESYRKFVGIIQESERKPEVILCLPPPVFHNEKYKHSEKLLTEEIIPFIKKLAEEKNLQTIDLYAALKPMEAFFPDGLHPQDDAVNKMAQTVYEALQANDRFKEINAKYAVEEVNK